MNRNFLKTFYDRTCRPTKKREPIGVLFKNRCVYFTIEEKKTSSNYEKGNSPNKTNRLSLTANTCKKQLQEAVRGTIDGMSITPLPILPTVWPHTGRGRGSLTVNHKILLFLFKKTHLLKIIVLNLTGCILAKKNGLILQSAKSHSLYAYVFILFSKFPQKILDTYQHCFLQLSIKINVYAICKRSLLNCHAMRLHLMQPGSSFCLFRSFFYLLM